MQCKTRKWMSACSIHSQMDTRAFKHRLLGEERQLEQDIVRYEQDVRTGGEVEVHDFTEGDLALQGTQKRFGKKWLPPELCSRSRMRCEGSKKASTAYAWVAAVKSRWPGYWPSLGHHTVSKIKQKRDQEAAMASELLLR